MATPTDVAASAGEAGLPAAAGIGPRVAAFRRRRGLTASELARRVGVSTGLISQIERGQSKPSVSTLFTIAEVLAVPMDRFFRESAAGSAPSAGTAPDRTFPALLHGGGPDVPAAGRHPYRVRRHERATIDVQGVTWARLTPMRLDGLEFMELTYAPGAESHDGLYRHPGIEMVVVLAGELTIFVGFDRFDLEEGSSICFPATTPHRYVNSSDDEVRALTVIAVQPGAPAHDDTTTRS